MLVSPTEPKVLKQLGRVSSRPEKYGVDYLLTSPLGLIGIQRKELSDLVASLKDGRLSLEIGQMRSLDVGIVLIEGRAQWTNDGYLLLAGRSSISRAQLLGLSWSMQLEGFWMGWSTTLNDTYEYLSMLSRWSQKKEHHGIGGRPKAKGVWGKAENRDWGIHLLQSFPGIGKGTASEIYDYFGGVPMRWDCEMEELETVPGVGKVRARKMYEGLESE